MSEFEIDPVVNARAKKNLLWFSIFSIVMIFAGLTSAYLVSRGSVFWVEFKKPAEFIWSTVFVLAGSLFMYLAIQSIRKDKLNLVKIWVGLAFVTGILFTIFQYNGWRVMQRNGNALNTPVINNYGKYGLYYSLLYQGKEITFDGYDFYYQGEILSDEVYNAMIRFCEELMKGSDPHNLEHKYKLTDYGSGFTLKYQDQLVTYVNESLQVANQNITPEMQNQLYWFSESRISNRGDFMVSGRYGEDFVIWYKGKKLEYQNRRFSIEGRPLKAKEESDLNGAENQASAYTFAFVLMHVLHLIGGFIALFVIWIRSIQQKYSSSNYLGMQLGSIYWHFLGILWIYLYGFLIFIH